MDFSLIAAAHAETAQQVAGAAPKMDPLHHFQVVNYIKIAPFGFDISISNSVVWMWIVVGVVYGLFRLAMRHPTLVPGRLQSVAEAGYLFVETMINEIIGHEGKKFFPIIFTLFFFVLFCNWTGLIPGSFTVTSQLIVTGTLALCIFAFSIFLGAYHHGWKFLGFFVPHGLPPALLPLMVPIEIISFLARPISLSVRLFANMTAGHTVLGVLFFFTATMAWFGAWLPFGFTVVFTGMEIFIGFIQAYIFTILTCVYINDSLHMH
ncbi:MAG: F0F1 ATP synthase subunit A [Magnetococcales bacterium]|nr:F0F1 ATP synthase subunit A [Magnetococcales bacterium]